MHPTACIQHQLPVHEYAPTEIKQAVVGLGRAKKEQVQMMVLEISNRFYIA